MGTEGRATDRKPTALLASAFSPAVLSSLGMPRVERLPASLAAVLDLVADDLSASLANAFDAAHAELARSYRSEYLYKNAIVSRLVFGRHSPNTASALLELPAGSSIADLVVLNGTSTAYEVKTDFDDFSRLSTQLADYARCFEHVNVVASTERIDALLPVLPEAVGALTLRKNGSLSVARPSRGGLDHIDPQCLYAMLRKQETLSLLNRTHGYEADAPPGDLWHRCRRLFLELPVEVAHDEVLRELRRRGARQGALALHADLPHSLRALAYASRLTAGASARVAERLAEPAIAFRGLTPAA